MIKGKKDTLLPGLSLNIDIEGKLHLEQNDWIKCKS